jgi:hypothetical protein
MCLQCGFWARQYLVSRGDAASWFDDFETPARQEQVRLEQRAYAAAYQGWAARSKGFYRLALLTMFAALLVVCLPTTSGDGSIQSGWRWMAALLAALAFLFEALWTASVALLRVPMLRRFPLVQKVFRKLFLPDAHSHH